MTQASVIAIDHCSDRHGIAKTANPRIHQHPYTEVFYFVQGKASIIALDRTYQVSLYDMVVYPQNTPHQVQWELEKNCRFISLGLYLQDFDLDETLLLKDPQGHMLWLMERIHHEYHTRPREEALVGHYVNALLLLIARQQQELTGHTDSFGTVLQYIAEHYAEPLTVEALAQLIPVSTSYLSRLFRERTGHTPMQYVHLVRIEAAKRLLSQTALSIEEIAGHVGYVSSKHFSRLFRTAAGESPRQFRQNGVHF